MANVIFNQSYFVLSSATALGDNVYVLGDASDTSVGTFAIQIVNLDAGTCTFDVKGRSRLAASQTGAQPPFVAIPYLPLYLNGGAGTYGSGSTAQITTDSLILVPATGLQVALDVNWTSGTFAVYIDRLIGSAA